MSCQVTLERKVCERACEFRLIFMFGCYIHHESMLLYACQFRPIFMFGCHIQQKSILLYIVRPLTFEV